jgi:hypothetical protein
VNAVEAIVTQKMKWIWREQFVSDFGIDGQIEVVSNGKPIGKLFAVQVKSGVSYFSGKKNSIPFYVDDDHLKYWDQHSLPTILVLHNPSENLTVWQWANLKAARATEKGWRIDVPRAKVFDVECKLELQDQVWSDDAIDLRRRFALDRKFMQEFDGRDAYVTIDKWVNKSLQYREIRIYFDDPDKKSPDFEIPIMATSNYDIHDIVQHFLPWLEYEYMEEPDDSSGEIEGHVLNVQLSKVAKGFLEVERFFENPQFSSDQGAIRDESDVDWSDAHTLDDER